jgi:hypothetical protein
MIFHPSQIILRDTPKLDEAELIYQRLHEWIFDSVRGRNMD